MAGLHRIDRGFSLVEMMVAIGILATALLLVVGVFTHLFAASQKSVDMTAGTIVAESVLQTEVERIQYDPAVNTAFYSNAYNVPGLITTGTYQLNQAVFTYYIYAQDIGSITHNSAALKHLTVYCTWWDSGGGLPGAKRTNYGLLQVELSRFMLYEARY